MSLLICAAFGVAVALLMSVPAAACWSADDVNLEPQLEKSSKWGVIHVAAIRYTGVQTRGEMSRTWIDFEWVDPYGKVLGTGTFWHEGADVDGGTIISTMPRMQKSRFYLVILRDGALGLQLVQEAMSVLEIEEGTSGTLSPWDAVRLSWAHGFVPPGGTDAVSDAQLYEVVDGLGLIETRVKVSRGTP